MFQEAVAVALEHEINRLNSDDCYFKKMPIELQEKRNFMATFLRNAGFLTTIPQGGCFLLANWTPLGKYLKFYLPNSTQQLIIKSISNHLILLF